MCWCYTLFHIYSESTAHKVIRERESHAEVWYKGGKIRENYIIHQMIEMYN